MSLPTDWRADPVVLVEGDMIPALTLSAQMLCSLALGDDEAAIREAWTSATRRTLDTLATGVDCYLVQAGFPLSAEDKQQCTVVSQMLTAFVRTLSALRPDDISDIKSAHADLFSNLEPAMIALLDRIREHFIGSVIKRQALHAERSGRAVSELSGISEKIFFISINASVEAARVGEMGKGFTVIASEIRALAQEAQTAIKAV